MLLSKWLTGFTETLSRSRHSNGRWHRRRPQVQDVLRPSELANRVDVLEDRTLLSAPHPFDLGTLNGTNGFRLDGIDADDRSGRSVSSAGDVNGDGFDDLIIWK